MEPIPVPPKKMVQVTVVYQGIEDDGHDSSRSLIASPQDTFEEDKDDD
jgi:hypothetical protein